MKKLSSIIILIISFSFIVPRVSCALGNPQTRQSSLKFSQIAADDQVWNISDYIDPTLEDVEWIEEGNYSKPPSWISDGRWYESHSRQTLVNSDDIFVSLSEIFNWTAVNGGLLNPYSSFEEFENEVKGDPSWWLGYSWGINVTLHGVNSTMVETKFNASTARTELYIWCHITNVSEYVVGGQILENWITGFDLTAVSISKLEDLQLQNDDTIKGRYYYIYFKAPAKLLWQYGNTYSLKLEVSPHYQGQSCNFNQTIKIFMPTNTEVYTASPSSIVIYSENTVTFTIYMGDIYPTTFRVTSGPPNERVWRIYDAITPTLDSVEWVEEGNRSSPPDYILDGRWYESHKRLTLVKSDDIFVSLSEIFNWTAVNEGLLNPYSSFEEFKNETTKDPSWWLKYSWRIDVNWHGVPLNDTKVEIEFDPDTSRTKLYIWCHITHVPEYVIGEQRLEKWLTGFDLTGVSIGKLEDLQLYEDDTTNGSYYYIYFKAPARFLTRSRDTYLLTLKVYPDYRNVIIIDVEQIIQISMPPDTEVQSASLLSMATYSGNIITFTVHKTTVRPTAFTATSGPPVKDPMQSLFESAGRWLIEPSTWVAFGSLIVLFYTAFRGKRIWSRRRTYYRLYRSMVNMYQHYAFNFAQFYQEIENLSRSITRYFVEDRITDEQFDRLLTRRDDLIERARKLQPPASSR